MSEWSLILIPVHLIIHKNMGYFFLYLECILKLSESIEAVMKVGKVNCEHFAFIVIQLSV